MTKAGKHISFHLIGSEEMSVLAAMHRQIWQKAYAAIFPEEKLRGLRQDDFLASWQEREAEGCWRLFWVCQAEEKTGFVVYGEAGDKAMEIKSFYFLPAYWGKGVADAAMLELLKQAGKEDYKEVFLWVLEENHRAQQFYRSHGFSPTYKTQTRERLGFTIKEQQMSRIL